MMLKVKVPTAAGNAVIQEGRLPAVLKRLVDELRPEAAYFFVEDGMRASLFVFEMDGDTTRIPAIVEPIFLGMEASVELVPVMNAQELQAGLERLAASGSPG